MSLFSKAVHFKYASLLNPSFCTELLLFFFYWGVFFKKSNPAIVEPEQKVRANEALKWQETKKIGESESSEIETVIYATNSIPS